MKMLILGGNGMAGHMLVQYFRDHAEYDVVYTSRDPADAVALHLDALNFAEADRILERVRPDVVINAIGILNQAAEQQERIAKMVNGEFPHWIAGKLDEMGYGRKLVHISTDCVFSGEFGEQGDDLERLDMFCGLSDHEADEAGSGNENDASDSNISSSTGQHPSFSARTVRNLSGRYQESDVADGTSVYARTKAQGEVVHSPHLTIRTSIIGPEIRPHGIGLLGWFLQQSSMIDGYTNVLWNGVTTLQLAKSIDRLLHRGASGLVHLTAPEIICKHDLLHHFAQIFEKQDIRIVPADEHKLDRTLASTRDELDLEVPDYSTMLSELRDWMRSR